MLAKQTLILLPAQMLKKFQDQHPELDLSNANIM